MQQFGNRKNNFSKDWKERKKNEQIDENKYTCSRNYTIAFELETLAKLNKLSGNTSKLLNSSVFPMLLFKIAINTEKNGQMLQDDMKEYAKDITFHWIKNNEENEQNFQKQKMLLVTGSKEKEKQVEQFLHSKSNHELK